MLNMNKLNGIVYIFALVLIPQLLSGQGYRLCDVHQHTTFTDGSYSMGRVFAVCDSMGLAWWANSEHGGISGRNGILSGLDTGKSINWDSSVSKGDSLREGQMWRWQTIRDFSYPYLVSERKKYPDRMIIQGLEWNVPGHEHASMAVVEQPDAVVRFEYQFDNNDKDISGGKAEGWEKSTAAGHAKTLEGLTWLQENYPTNSWVIPAHPERRGQWSIADFRDCNNIAPDVFFGFEGIPGHQRSPNRGEFSPQSNTYGGYTYGGAGWMTAKVGGVWDALLSEGRRFWLYSFSDFHSTHGDFYPGEYNKTNVYMPENNRIEHLADYLRSGNVFTVSGNLIDNLSFRINNHTMGETHFTANQQIVLSIEISQPKDAFPLHHVDLIEGVVGGYHLQGTPAYNADSVSTTRVIKRYLASKTPSGKIIINDIIIPASGHTYYRLRGTHHAPGTTGETDMNGNPLPDNTPNTSEKTLNDLWFYSNPIFVKQVNNAIEIVSHRGAIHLAPENTSASIRKALEHGTKWIEIDVRTSKDGVLYNFHDMILSRTTNGTGFFHQHTSQEIDRLDAGSWYSPEFAGEPVPRVADLLDSLKGKANVYFDVKDADLKQLIQLVREKGYTDKCFFWFGSLAKQREFLSLAPDLKIKVNASTVSRLKEWLEECYPVKPAIVETGIGNITHEFRSFCRSQGIRIMPIITGENTSRYRDAILLEADMINIDRPEVFQDMLLKF